jgi:hypothetical protein
VNLGMTYKARYSPKDVIMAPRAHVRYARSLKVPARLLGGPPDLFGGKALLQHRTATMQHARPMKPTIRTPQENPTR